MDTDFFCRKRTQGKQKFLPLRIEHGETDATLAHRMTAIFGCTPTAMILGAASATDCLMPLAKASPDSRRVGESVVF